MADLCLDCDTAGVSVFYDLARRCDVLIEALHGGVDHDGCESEIDGLFACLEAFAVIEVEHYRNACLFGIFSADQSRILEADVVSQMALCDTYDQRQSELLGEGDVVLDALHVEHVG